MGEQKVQMQMFRWHEAAVLQDHHGAEVAHPGAFAPLLPDRPGVAALGAVMAGGGRPFRIGGTGALEAGSGAFETLTGGSLGAARRIMRSQASWCASFVVNAGLFGIGPGVSVAVLGRLSHSLALYGAVEGLHLGARVHCLDGIRPDRQAQALAARGVAVLYATPAQLHGVAVARVALPDLQHVLVGGAAFGGVARAALQRVAPAARVHVFYGAAEASFITLADDGAEKGAVGHPYPGVEVRLGVAGALGAQEGQIWVKSPYLFQGYAGADRGGAVWCDGWLGLGEIGVMTPQGLVLRGRAGRMVTVADRNVFPEEIEVFLAGLPGVDRVAVVPRVDPVRGAVLLAYVSGNSLHEAAILTAARDELGAMVAPKALIWLEDWPELASGKTDLGALEARAAAWR
jgi:long-chain acyl-CoA synthetase